ncbi:MAG: beta-lactamase family protein [Kiritimatiellaeota bacterium]|nr:beta-lactamase family protein [Kiritimatiellota bacterium]
MDASDFSYFARERIRRAAARGDIPGGVVFAGRGSETICREAAGARALTPKRLPMRPDTIFDLASLTKPLATMFALLLLRQDDTIPSFEVPIAEFVPALAASDKAEISLAALLCHTSGLPPYLNTESVAARYPGLPGDEQVLHAIRDAPLRSSGGESVRYSCLNFIVAARVVQELTGRRLDVFLQERVWDPLGLRNTFFFPTRGQRRRCAPTTCTESGEDCLQGTVHDPLARLVQSARKLCSGNAGLFSTAHDVGVLIGALLAAAGTPATARRHRLSTGSPLAIPGELVRELWRKRTPADVDPSFGLGWRIFDPGHDFGWKDAVPPPVGHTGYTGTLIWVDPASGAWLVLLTNRVHPRDSGAVHPLRNEILSKFKEVCRSRPRTARQTSL